MATQPFQDLALFAAGGFGGAILGEINRFGSGIFAQMGKDAGRQGGTDDLADGMMVIVGDAFEKRRHGKGKKRLTIDNFRHRFQTVPPSVLPGPQQKTKD